MAGGYNAGVVPCRYCHARAPRTFEGVTTDTYKCLACGGVFGIAWGECGGEPTMPQWPADAYHANAHRARDIAPPATPGYWQPRA